jgi:hypothetical protein
MVIGIRGTIEIIITDAKLFTELLPLGHQLIQILLYTLTMLSGSSKNLQAMLVYANIKKDLLFTQFFSEVPGVCICLKKLNCMSHVWHRISIRKCSSYVKHPLSDSPDILISSVSHR